LLRGDLRREGFVTAEDLRGMAGDDPVRVAGLVITRQRPGSAGGVMFVTLEDETGYVNLVVWPRLAERQRQALLGSRLLAVKGQLQRQGDVLHVVVSRAEDRSAALGALAVRSRDFA
jgi:error-prone DNA polymerase